MRLIRAAALTGYVDVARNVGLQPSRMLARVGLTERIIADPEARIPATAVWTLLEQSADAAGIDDFGLRMVERRRLSDLGPFGLVIREEPNLRQVLVEVQKFARHHSVLEITVEASDVLVTIGFRHAGKPRRQFTELNAGIVAAGLRDLLEGRWMPQKASFAHAPPKSTALHRALFGPNVEFSARRTTLVCLQRDLERTIPRADPGMARHARRYVELSTPRRAQSTQDSVRDLVRLLLPTGRCRADVVAAQLGVDRRSVHRHLKRTGHSFKDLVEDVRQKSVRTQLATDMPLSDVAERLGFRGLSSFSRWFVSRFGCSATAWRASRRKARRP